VRRILTIVLLAGAFVAAGLFPRATSQRERKSATEAPATEPRSVQSTKWASAKTCAPCHKKEAEAWARSPHGLHAVAVTSPKRATDAAVGSRWMQAFIRRDESGHHRILPQCYNLRDEAWASVRSVLDDIRGTVRNSESPPLPDIGSRSFEIECSGCHTSGARLRLDPASGNMQSHWRDGAIDCEACHGPGGEHAKAWRNLDAGTPMPRLEQLNRRAATAICARCHGGPPTGPEFSPSDAQHFVGILDDRDGLFPNGTASGQIYQHAGFVRSPCEVGCSACHDPHEPSLRPTEHTDALCSRCHQEELSRAHTHHDMSGIRRSFPARTRTMT